MVGGRNDAAGVGKRGKPSASLGGGVNGAGEGLGGTHGVQATGLHEMSVGNGFVRSCVVTDDTTTLYGNLLTAWLLDCSRLACWLLIVRASI